MPGEAMDVTSPVCSVTLSFPDSGRLYMDSAYTDYYAEDTAREMDEVAFEIPRRKNSKRGDDLS